MNSFFGNRRLYGTGLAPGERTVCSHYCPLLCPSQPHCPLTSPPYLSLSLWGGQVSDIDVTMWSQSRICLQFWENLGSFVTTTLAVQDYAFWAFYQLCQEITRWFYSPVIFLLLLFKTGFFYQPPLNSVTCPKGRTLLASIHLSLGIIKVE